MNLNTIVWALLTGLITGGAWLGIVVFRHQRELDRYDHDDLLDMERRLAELEQVTTRVAELEERVDFAERLLAAGRDSVKLSSEPPIQSR